MQVELLDMLDAGNTGLAVGYAAASIVVGFAAVTARDQPRPARE